MSTIYLPFETGQPAPRVPSERNRNVFRTVRVLMKSQRDAAKEFGVSHTRVQAILTQVEQWIAQTKGCRQGSSWKERLIVTEEVHRQRLDHLYAQALQAWQESRSEQRVSKITQVEGQPAKREVTVRTSAGDRRYLETALKIELERLAFEDQSRQMQEPDEEEMTDQERYAELKEMVRDSGLREDDLPQAKSAVAPPAATSTTEPTAATANAEVSSTPAATGSQRDEPAGGMAGAGDALAETVLSESLPTSSDADWSAADVVPDVPTAGPTPIATTADAPSLMKATAPGVRFPSQRRSVRHSPPAAALACGLDMRCHGGSMRRHPLPRRRGSWE